jgi:hypothetical protein
LEANKEGYPCLLSGGAPDSPGAPPDSHCRWSGADLLPILAQTTVASPGQLAHRTLSGAHRTVRCSLPTVGVATRRPRIAWPTIGADDHWLTGQSCAPPDSPVNYSRTPPIFPESGLFTGSQPGAPDTVRCARTSSTLAAPSQVICNSFLLTVSST